MIILKELRHQLLQFSLIQTRKCLWKMKRRLALMRWTNSCKLLQMSPWLIKELNHLLTKIQEIWHVWPDSLEKDSEVIYWRCVAKKFLSSNLRSLILRIHYSTLFSLPNFSAMVQLKRDVKSQTGCLRALWGNNKAHLNTKAAWTEVVEAIIWIRFRGLDFWLVLLNRSWRKMVLELIKGNLLHKEHRQWEAASKDNSNPMTVVFNQLLNARNS